MPPRRGGVLGTNGVVLLDVKRGSDKRFNIGWFNPCEKTFEVDYVGHSWFIRREYLNWMLKKTYKNKFKYSGEDMCLSYACLEHGVKTYVPAHPKNILSLWGSIPKYGIEYGTDKSAALSLSPVNEAEKQRAVIEMHNDGWRFLFERESEYIEELVKIFVKSPPSPNEMLQNNTKILLKIFGKKPPAFIGDSKYASVVKNLFALMDIDYIDVVTRNNVLNFKPYAFNIFFTDAYPQVKKFLESAGFKENEHFIDGRYFLMLM